MKKLFFVTVLLFSCLMASAQQKHVFLLKDRGTKEHLPGAVATIKGSASSFAADSAGAIVIGDADKGLSTIIFKYVGYEILEQTFNFANLPDTVIVLLDAEEEELEEVQVSATRSSRSINDIPTRIETISASCMKKR